MVSLSPGVATWRRGAIREVIGPSERFVAAGCLETSSCPGTSPQSPFVRSIRIRHVVLVEIRPPVDQSSSSGSLEEKEMD